MQNLSKNDKSIKLGLLCGIIFGLLAVLVMIPLEFTDKTIALTAAFINRFAIGFLIPTSKLSIPYWLQGIVIALLLSVPDAMITGSYIPIIAMGVLGGFIIGLVTQKLVK